MVHVYNEVANQEMQTSGYSSILLEKIIMVLTKIQNILILKQSLLPYCSIIELLTVLLEYIDLFLSKEFSHVVFSIDQ